MSGKLFVLKFVFYVLKIYTNLCLNYKITKRFLKSKIKLNNVYVFVIIEC